MALNSRDVQKILKAGFTIIREDRERLLIKCKTEERNEWYTWEKNFKSKTEMRRRMDSYLKYDKVIED
jgi:hypothetical protein